MQKEQLKNSLIRYWWCLMSIGGIIAFVGIFLSAFEALKDIGLIVLAIGGVVFVSSCFLWAFSDWG